MSQPAIASAPAVHAFDALAEDYDAVFTDSWIGRAQRTAVWEYAAGVFPRGCHLLELNCGTGEDAVHFAQQGLTVTACDISEAMIGQARRKAAECDVADKTHFDVRAIEDVTATPHTSPFEGAFSNFSGLNCVEDLSQTAKALASLLQPESPMLFCLSTRVCVWEILWFLAHGDGQRAVRRLRGHHKTKIGKSALSVYYPTLRQLRRQFAPFFHIVSVHGIGITVPPSYAESWIGRQPRLLRVFRKIDAAVSGLPGFRILGDHMLVHLERTSA